MKLFRFSAASIAVQFPVLFAITSFAWVQSPGEFVAELKQLEVKLVVFDMDKTAAKRSSGGAISTTNKDELETFLKSASEDFKTIVPILLKHKFHVGIATMSSDQSDSLFSTRKVDKVRGQELVRQFLQRTFPNGEWNQISIVAERQNDKTEHMRKLCEKYDELKLEQAILFDDNADNVGATNGFLARQVDGSKGFRLSDIENQGFQPSTSTPVLNLPARARARR